MLDATLTHAPLASLRRDPVYRRARWLAAAVLSLAQAGWMIAFIIAVHSGRQMTGTLALLLLGGVLFIQLRTRIVSELALGLVDRWEGLDFAPSPQDIFQRTGLALAVPLLAFALAFLRAEDATMVIACMAVVLLSEGIYRLGGFSQWKRLRLHPPVLKALLTGSTREAVSALEQDSAIDADEFESSALAIAGVGIRQKDRILLDRLTESLAERAAGDGASAIIERTLKVVAADRARMVDPTESSVAEAHALATLPASHPGRLAFSLFVATAALEQQDPGSAIKALGRLHSRDVVPNAARVLVNWLLMKAAEQTGDTPLAERCRRALATFDLRKESGHLNASGFSDDDPYFLWVERARSDLRPSPPAEGRKGHAGDSEERRE